MGGIANVPASLVDDWYLQRGLAQGLMGPSLFHVAAGVTCSPVATTHPYHLTLKEEGSLNLSNNSPEQQTGTAKSTDWYEALVGVSTPSSPPRLFPRTETPEERMKKLLEEDYKHRNKPAYHKELSSSFNEQVAGSHYKELPIQPIEFITKNDLSFIVGNIVKYACRADKKGGAEDIKKCIHYARMLLEQKYLVKSEINYDDVSTK